jgi:hypothetical protein
VAVLVRILQINPLPCLIEVEKGNLSCIGDFVDPAMIRVEDLIIN